MLTRLAVACLPAALLLAGVPHSPALAKPPGLPIDPKVRYQETVPQQEVHSEPVKNDVEVELDFKRGSVSPNRAGALLFGIGLDSEAGIFLNLNLGLRSPDESSSAARDMLRDIWDYLRAQLDGNSGFMGIEVSGEFAVGGSIVGCSPTRTASAPTICPYLKCRIAEKAQPAEAQQATTVLDNIQKLEKAQALYQMAESERAAGNCDRACQAYMEIHKLCPGSRYDELAARRHVEMQREQKQAEGIAEEEEIQPVPWWPAGVQVDCTARLGTLSVTTKVGPDGHGSLMFGLGYESLLATSLLWEQRDALLKCLQSLSSSGK